MRALDTKHARDRADDHDDLRGTPGRTTLTSRLPASATSIAHEVVHQLQAKGDLAGPDAHEVAAHGMTGAGGALPFFGEIQRAFGHHDLTGVRAFVGGRAGEASSALGARAYASGNSVAFASAPDLHLAAHEAAHVVQQRGGVRLSGGIGRAGDEYEVNADAVADLVVRGQSAQDLLDPFSHRGASGGAAVQRQEHTGTSAGVRDLDRMLLGRRPTPAQIVACMRRHPDDARAILARVHDRLGESVALQVELEVATTAPELVPVLGSARAHGTSPVGTTEPHAGALESAAPPRASAVSPVDLRAEGDGVSASVRPDEHSRVEASLAPGAGNPLRDVRVVVAAETEGGEASGELAVGADVEEGRATASVSGEARPDGDRGPTLTGEASVSAGSGESGGLDVHGSARVAIAVPVADHAQLIAAGIISDDGRLRVEASAELLRSVRGLPATNRAREPLLRLFMSVETDLATGDTNVSGGASVQFDRDMDDHDDPAETHRLAVAGTSGGGSALPHLAKIQAAFGHHDISGVRAHVGGNAAASAGTMGARGYAVGDDIAFAAAPDLHLAAHEAAHVVQQRGGVRLSGGVGRTGDEYERHADAVADLVVRGDSAQSLLDERAHRGATGGPAIQRDAQEDRAWLATLHRDAAGHYTAADGRELSAGEQRRLRRILRQLSGGTARTAPRERPESVATHERLETEHPDAEIPHTELDDDRARTLDETGTSRRRGRHGGAVDSATGGRRRRSVTLDDGRVARREDIRETRRHAEHGERAERTERGHRVEAVRGPTGESEVVEEDVTTTTTARDHNPLDGTLAHGERREHRTRALDGTGRSTADHTSTTADLAEGAIEHTRDVEASRTAEDGTTRTRRHSVATRGSVGDGRASVALRTRAERSRTDASGAETGTARETTTSAGAIVTEDETGGRFGRTTRTETEGAYGVTTARESSTAVEVTDRRVGASHSRGGEIVDGDTRSTARVSADGSFAIDVEPIGDGSGRFRLTFTIHVGASGSAGTTHEARSGDRGSFAISGRASGRGDLVTSRVISEADAQQYLDAADRAERGEAVSDPPEFGRLARLRAAGERADALLESGAVFGGASTASSMEDGESITLDTEVGVGGDVSGGGTAEGLGGVSVGAGGDARWRRTVQVERVTVGGLPRVRMTVTYHDETEAHASASASVADVGAARVRGARERGATDSVQFVLDPQGPEYGARYDAIVGTVSRTQLRALEREYASDVRRSRHATTGADEHEYEGGPTSSMMVGMRARTTRSDDVSTTMDADGNATGLEADISGGTESDLRIRAGDHDIDVAGATESVHGTVDSARGTHVDIEASDEHIDPVAAIADGAHAFSEADARGRVALVVAHTPAEHLRSALQEFSHTWGYHLGTSDLEAMGQRAADASHWSACCIVPDRDVRAAWSALRGALARPHPDAAQAQVDRAAALDIARVRALSTWMQQASGHGAECIERVLRRWAESATHEVSAERLGAGYEWPISLRHEHESYTTLVTQAGAIRDRFERALSRPSGNTEARSHYGDVSRGFETVLRQVRACTDFTSESRRSEMIREIEQHTADIHVRFQDFLRRWALLHHEHDTEGPTEEAIAATRASGADITAARSREYVAAGIRVLRANHTRETEMLQRVQAIMRDVGDSTIFGHRERAEAAQICSAVHDLHRTWIQQVQDVRQAYSQAGTAESAWRVSTGPGAERHRDLEPNVGWLIIEYSRVMQNSYDAYWHGRVEQWRQEGHDY